MDNQLIEIGYCSKPHGIKGGFVFHLYSGNESILREKSNVTLFPHNERSSVDIKGEKHAIESISYGNKVIVYLNNLSGRDIVESMIPFSIKISRSEFPNVDDDEYYVSDLIGLKVINHHTKKEIGIIDKFYDNGVQIVFVIKCLNNEKIEIPFIDHFFPVVDCEKGIVEIIVPEFINE